MLYKIVLKCDNAIGFSCFYGSWEISLCKLTKWKKKKKMNLHTYKTIQRNKQKKSNVKFFVPLKKNLQTNENDKTNNNLQPLN
jgi:hypothetical protein